MPIYNPKQLGEPEVIREINPTVLCAFLKPFESYLRTRGLEVREPSRIDNAAIEKLVDILINPTMKTPQRLLHAVFYVEEMSSPLAADSLLKLAIQAGKPFDEDANHTLADVIMQVWLFDSKMVEAQHAWQTWKTPRRMECFQPIQSTGIAPITITEDRLNLAIKDAGDWFAKNNRGRKVFMTPRIVTFLLLDLNSKRRDQKFDASARIVDCKPVEIEQLISVTADGRLLAMSKSRELITSVLGVTLESRLSGYVFQRKGKHRMLAFNSEIEITSETNGNWYIEQLLAKPNVAFRCTHLESLLAGFAEETSTGSIGEVVDMETLKGYRDRLQEIDEELEEATSFNDPSRQAKLSDERQAILDQVKSAQGLGGRVRQKFDAERSRKTVCKAISRSIEAIEKVHPELGLHLHKSINLGLEVSYSLDVVIDWLF